jgi:hypothetical protein
LTTVVVDAKGAIEHVWFRDLNGDRRPDLMLLVRTESDTQQIVVHYAHAKGRIRDYEDQRGEPFARDDLKETVLVALGDLTADPGLELALVSPTSTKAFVHRDGAFAEVKDLGPTPLAYTHHDVHGVRAWTRVFRPVEGSREALLLPIPDGFAAIRFPDEGPPRVERIGIPPERYLAVGSHDLFAIVTDHPTPLLTDYDGDGRTDVLAIRGAHLAAHLQSRKGALPEKPTFEFRMSFLEKGSGTTRDAFLRYLVDMADVDGDRRADLLVTRTRGKLELFTSFESQHFFYRGPSFYSRERNDLVSPPNGLIAVGGVSVNPTLLDLDKDGDRDLIVTAMKADAVGQHLLKRVLADYRAYRYDRRRGTFERSPFFSVVRRYPLWRLERGETDATVHFTGDYDGDGNLDLLDIAAGGEDRIEIRQGKPSGGMLSSGGYEFRRTLLRQVGKVETDVRILDADGDGTDDFLLYGGGKVWITYTGRR